MNQFLKKLRKPLLIAAIAAVSLFLLSLIVYFFNLDMKLTAMLQPLMDRFYDKRRREPMP